MYLENPKRLFDDLYKIGTLSSYMNAVADDGQEEDLPNLVSVVKDQVDNINNPNDSLRWDTSDIEDLDELAQIRKDAEAVLRIASILERELKAKWVFKCKECGEAYFYQKRPKYNLDYYSCTQCKGKLNLIKFKDWLVNNELDFRLREYIK